MWILYFLVIGLLLVDFCENSKVYITHNIGGAIKHCIPRYNCPPGHEILPCEAEYTKDICTSCPSGLVQPDYIQSTEDTTLTKCFKNKNVDKCRPEDLEPSRENNAKGCGSSADFCKCDTDKCYFGDPCACTYRECGLGETMLSNGTCLKCPAGTRKNESGCGPCFPSQVPVVSRQYVTTGIETLPLTEREATATLVPSIGKTQSEDGITHGRAHTPDSTEKASSNSLVVVVLAVFAVSAVVCIVLVLVWIRKDRSKTDQDADVIEQGEILVSATQNNKMKNDNIVNGNQDETGGNIENEVNKDNVNDESIKSTNDSCRDVFCSDNGCSNNIKDIEVKNVEELPIAITGIFDNKKDISYPVEHSDVDRIDITVGEQLITENIEDVYKIDCMEKHKQMSLSQAPRLDKDSLNTNSTTGYAHLTEHSLKPVTQVSHERFDQSTEEVSSGYGSEEFPHCSPISYDKGPGSLQKYGELVSVSVSNGSTEGTEIITSGLESFNYKLTGLTTPSVHSESIHPKQIIIRNDSGVYDSGNG